MKKILFLLIISAPLFSMERNTPNANHAQRPVINNNAQRPIVAGAGAASWFIPVAFTTSTLVAPQFTLTGLLISEGIKLGTVVAINHLATRNQDKEMPQAPKQDK